MHIPKTAGTSFREGVAQQVGQERVAWAYDIHVVRGHEDEITELVSPEMQLLSGHLDWSVVRLMEPRPVLVVTFLRHPLERTVSVFRHFQAVYGYEGAFAQFVEEHPLQVRDVMARRIAGDMEGVTARDEYTQVALENLESESLLFGLKERYEESLGKMSEGLGLDLPRLVLNKGSDVTEAAIRECREFDEMWSADEAVYRRARELFSAGRSEMPKGFLWQS